MSAHRDAIDMAMARMTAERMTAMPVGRSLREFRQVPANDWQFRVVADAITHARWMGLQLRNVSIEFRDTPAREFTPHATTSLPEGGIQAYIQVRSDVSESSLFPFLLHELKHADDLAAGEHTRVDETELEARAIAFTMKAMDAWHNR